MSRKSPWDIGKKSKRDPRIVPGFKGDVAQVYVVILQLFYYFLQNKQFRITSEESEMGAMDDVVVRIEENGQKWVICYQVKHGASESDDDNIYGPADYHSIKSKKGIYAAKLFYGWCLANAKSEPAGEKVLPVLFSNNTPHHTMKAIVDADGIYTADFINNKNLTGKPQTVRTGISETIKQMIANLKTKGRTTQERKESRIVKQYIHQRQASGTNTENLIQEFLSEIRMQLGRDNYSTMREKIEKKVAGHFNSLNPGLFPFIYKELETWLLESNREINNESVQALFYQTYGRLVVLERWYGETERQLRCIETAIEHKPGESLHIPVQDEPTFIEMLTSQADCIILAGPHGAGKSALVKKVMQEDHHQEFIWLSAANLDDYMANLEVLPHLTQQVSYVIIDSTEIALLTPDNQEKLQRFYASWFTSKLKYKHPIKFIFTVLNLFASDLSELLSNDQTFLKPKIERLDIRGFSDENIESYFPVVNALHGQEIYEHLKNPWLLQQFLQLSKVQQKIAMRRFGFDHLAREILNLRLLQECEHAEYDASLVYHQCFRLLKKMVVAQEQSEPIHVYEDDIIATILSRLGIIDFQNSPDTEFVKPYFKHDLARNYAIYLYINDKFRMLVDIDQNPEQFLIEVSRVSAWAKQAVGFGAHIAPYLKNLSASDRIENHHYVLFYMLLEVICEKSIPAFRSLLVALPADFLYQIIFSRRDELTQDKDYNLETFIISFGCHEQLAILVDYKQGVNYCADELFRSNWFISDGFAIRSTSEPIEEDDTTYHRFDDSSSSESVDNLDFFNEEYYNRPQKYALSDLRSQRRIQDYDQGEISEFHSLFRPTKSMRLHKDEICRIENMETISVEKLPMLTAIVRNNFIAAAILLDGNRRYARECNKYRETALHRLCLSKDNSEQRLSLIYRLVMQYGADVDAVDLDDETALFNAVYNNNLALAQLLLELGANPNHQNQVDFTPLHLAVANQSGAMITLLLKYEADNKLEDCHGRDPLAYFLELNSEFGDYLDEIEDEESENSDSSAEFKFDVQFDLKRRLEAILHARVDYSLTFLRTAKKNGALYPRPTNNMKEVLQTNVFSSGLTPKRASKSAQSDPQLKPQSSKPSFNEHMIFAPPVYIKTMAAIGDGNCCFNAAILGVFKLVLTIDRLPESTVTGINNWLRHYVKQLATVTELRQWLVKNEKNYDLWQRTFSQPLRAFIVDEMAKSQPDQQDYHDALSNVFSADFLPVYKQLVRCRYPKPTSKELKPRILSAARRDGLDDTFIVHDFILTKMLDIAAKKMSIKDAVAELQHWWQLDGWKQYLAAIKKPAKNAIDLARWGGSNELTLLALKFDICIQYFRPRGHEYLGGHHGVIMLEDLSEDQLKILSDNNVLIPTKDRYVINPTIKTSDMLHQVMLASNKKYTKLKRGTIELVLSRFAQRSGLLIQLEQTGGHWDIIDATQEPAVSARQSVSAPESAERLYTI